MRPVQKEVYRNGDLEKIEVVDADSGEHMFDALWDPNDPQTPEAREAFRSWVNVMIVRKEQQNGN